MLPLPFTLYARSSMKLQSLHMLVQPCMLSLQPSEAKARGYMCSVDQRVNLLRHGLGERAQSVQANAVGLLRSWLQDACCGEPVALLRLLDVQLHEGMHLFYVPTSKSK